MYAVCSIIAQDGEAQKEPIQSITEDRRETLLYGIDDQVIELIVQLNEEKDDTLAGEVFAAYKTTRNPKVRSAIFTYFKEIGFEDAREDALSIIDTADDQTTELISAAIDYLSVKAEPELADRLIPLLDSPDMGIARKAIKGIGASQKADTIDTLLGLLDDGDYPNDLKPDVILALGELKNPAAVPRLVEILDDEGEDIIWRRYACASLGKIGDPEILPKIEEALYDTDPMLRNYAVASLKYFDDPEVVDLLIAALKDSYWRTRISAASGLGSLKEERAVPILAYKAEKDPETNVRVEAVRALGAIATPEAIEALRGFYSNESTPPSLRVVSAEILAEKDIDASLELFTAVINKHWGKDRTRILERTAKILSKTKSDSLESLYAKFLVSGELVIMIYGLRGIATNEMISLKAEVEKLSGEENHRSIRKEALAALEVLE